MTSRSPRGEGCEDAAARVRCRASGRRRKDQRPARRSPRGGWLVVRGDGFEERESKAPGALELDEEGVTPRALDFDLEAASGRCELEVARATTERSPSRTFRRRVVVILVVVTLIFSGVIFNFSAACSTAVRRLKPPSLE